MYAKALHTLQVSSDWCQGCLRFQVWKATHIESKEVRALKVVFWGNPDIKEHHRRILKKEVVMLREMQHEHIVRLLHDSDDGKNLIMALEYLKGGGLLEHLVEVEHYTEERAASLFTQMLQAVCYMHSKHIMHRDIKVCQNKQELLLRGPAFAPDRCVTAADAFSAAYHTIQSVHDHN